MEVAVKMGETQCLFCRIANREVPSDVVYEDDEVMAFRDINPQAPVHVLVIPRRHIDSIAEVSESDRDLMGHVMVTAVRLASNLGVSDGFRVVVNAGEKAGQSVWHVHVHLLGGRVFSWPPG
ncbi:MAG: histidine triad nucleotide-binding protein [Bacillota bacterium]